MGYKYLTSTRLYGVSKISYSLDKKSRCFATKVTGKGVGEKFISLKRIARLRRETERAEILSSDIAEKIADCIRSCQKYTEGIFIECFPGLGVLTERLYMKKKASEKYICGERNLKYVWHLENMRCKKNFDDLYFCLNPLEFLAVNGNNKLKTFLKYQQIQKDIIARVLSETVISDDEKKLYHEQFMKNQQIHGKDLMMRGLSNVFIINYENYFPKKLDYCEQIKKYIKATVLSDYGNLNCHYYNVKNSVKLYHHQHGRDKLTSELPGDDPKFGEVFYPKYAEKTTKPEAVINDTSITLFGIITPKTEIQTLQDILVSLTMIPGVHGKMDYSSIFGHQKLELFLFCSPRIYREILNARSDKRNGTYFKRFGVLFNVFFETKLVMKVPTDAFTPVIDVNKSFKEVTFEEDTVKRDEMYLLHMIPNREMTELFNAQEMLKFVFWLQAILKSGKSRYIPLMENWIPEVGWPLTTMGITMLTKVMDIPCHKLYSIYTEMRNWPTYKSSMFSIQLEKKVHHLEMEQAPGYNKDIHTTS